MLDSEPGDFSFGTVVAIARQVLLDPRSFFARLPKHGGYGEPVIFVGIMSVIAGVLGAVLSNFTPLRIGGMTFAIESILVIPLAAIIGSFIAGGLMHAVWTRMGSRQDFETTYRCVAFSTAIIPVATLIAVLPYFGTLVVNIWWFWLMLLASVTVHGLDLRKSQYVLGALALVVILLNLSGEKTQREFDARDNEFNQQMGELQNMSPDSPGETTGN